MQSNHAPINSEYSTVQWGKLQISSLTSLNDYCRTKADHKIQLLSTSTLSAKIHQTSNDDSLTYLKNFCKTSLRYGVKGHVGKSKVIFQVKDIPEFSYCLHLCACGKETEKQHGIFQAISVVENAACPPHTSWHVNGWEVLVLNPMRTSPPTQTASLPTPAVWQLPAP